MLLADLDLRALRRARREFDVTGHYARDDVFQLHVGPRATTEVR
jgi:nitrilase